MTYTGLESYTNEELLTLSRRADSALVSELANRLEAAIDEAVKLTAHLEEQ